MDNTIKNVLNAITFILNGTNVVASLQKMLNLLINLLGVLLEIRNHFIHIAVILEKKKVGLDMNYVGL